MLFSAFLLWLFWLYVIGAGLLWGVPALLDAHRAGFVLVLCWTVLCLGVAAFVPAVSL